MHACIYIYMGVGVAHGGSHIASCRIYRHTYIYIYIMYISQTQYTIFGYVHHLHTVRDAHPQGLTHVHQQTPDLLNPISPSPRLYLFRSPHVNIYFSSIRLCSARVRARHGRLIRGKGGEHFVCFLRLRVLGACVWNLEKGNRDEQRKRIETYIWIGHENAYIYKGEEKIFIYS